MLQYRDPRFAPLRYTTAGFVSADAAAASAWSNRRPLDLEPGERPFVLIDPVAEGASTNRQRHELLMRAIAWQASCITPDDARVKLRLSGYFPVEAYDALGTGVHVPVRQGGAPVLALEGESATEYTITSISYSAPTSSYYYTVTVTVTSALPSYVVAGYALGARNVQGDNDAEALTGALKVLTIASDRLSFTAHLINRRAAPLVSPTTITTSGTDSGVNRSRILVPSACICVESTDGWTGSSTEGYFNVERGGRLEMDSLGLSSSLTASPTTSLSQDGVFIGTGATGRLDDSVITGFPDKNVRMFARAFAYINRSCIGGMAQETISEQAGCMIESVRSWYGNADTECIVIGTDSHFEASGGGVAGGTAGVFTTGVGATANVPTFRLMRAVRGAYPINGGRIQFASTTKPLYNEQTMDWLSGGSVIGDPDPTSLATNTSTPDADSLTGGGYWQQTSTKNPTPPGDLVALGDDALATITLSGSGGLVELIPETLAEQLCVLSIDAVSAPAGEVFVSIYAGPDIELGNVDGSDDFATLGDVTDGKIGVTVWMDGSTPKLLVRNRGGGSRRWRAAVRGKLTLSAAVYS